MWKVVLARAASLIPILLGIAIVAFFAVRLVPGDPVDVMLGDSYNEELAATLREQMGLDASIPEQFALWASGVVRGDLGTSIRSGDPVTSEISRRLPATLQLAGAALVVSLLIAIPLGVASARRPNGIIDAFTRFLTVGMLSIPSFVFAMVLILAFAVWIPVLPSMGMARAGSSLGTRLSHLALPALALGLELIAVTTKMTRASFLDVSRQDFVRTARSKGLRERRVTYAHTLRNSLVPVITVVGIQVGALIGGTVIIEQVFSWPGVGSMLVRAISQRDYPLVQGTVMFLALAFVAANFLADLLYIAVNPRLRRA